jgi:putative cardiolipin synthase
MAWFLLGLLLTSCASVDFSYPKIPSQALPTEASRNTHIGRHTTAQASQHPGLSGFYMQFDGIDALAERLVLTAYAEKSIDAQYYLITNDIVGNAFILSLLQAADRGVRVRLLLDDIQTQGYDTGMAALDSHPNFEVRIFNPFAGRNFRIGDGITSFSRINRRMHNKSFTVDGHVTILGGRNIAAEYFGGHEEVNFGDADVIGIGPVVADVETMFDLYWNHEKAAAVPAFATKTADPAAALDVLRGRLEASFEAVKKTRYGEAVSADIRKFLDQSNDDQFYWGEYEVVYDSPDKANKKKAADAKNITTALAAAIARAQNKVVIVSPYFVPRKSGTAYFRKLRERGLRVVIVTNSLAANNHGIVHSGYAPSRKPLLEMGVEIYEVKTAKALRGVERGGAGSSLATLHTKAFFIDDTELFFGSFNWDPRSVNINTELGVIIKSKELGKIVGALVDENMAERTYKVILNDKGQLRWLDIEPEEPVIFDKEPDTTWWRRTKATLGRILPVRGQL